MNVNVKLSISDEDRNRMHNRLTGTNTKKMVSRADVNDWVKTQLEKFLNGSFGTQTGRFIPEPDQEPNFEEIDPEDIDVEEVIKQNVLLQSRVNRLQYLLDRK